MMPTLDIRRADQGLRITMSIVFLVCATACGGTGGSITDNSTDTPATNQRSQAVESNGWPTSLAGKWDDYGVQQDGVGLFVIIDSIGAKSYSANFFSQGQSGGIYDIGTAEIKDKGHGIAQVAWADGSLTSASWGFRDSNTSSDMSSDWLGDIWFDCVGHLDGADSRASCDFNWSTKQN